MPPKQTTLTDLQILLAVVSTLDQRDFRWEQIAKALKLSGVNNIAQSAYDRYRGLRSRHEANGSWPGPHREKQKRPRLATRGRKPGGMKPTTKSKKVPEKNTTLDDSEDSYSSSEDDYDEEYSSDHEDLPKQVPKAGKVVKVTDVGIGKVRGKHGLADKERGKKIVTGVAKRKVEDEAMEDGEEGSSESEDSDSEDYMSCSDG